MTQSHQREAAEAAPVAEPLMLPVALPEVEPVPVAPIELVLPELGAVDDVSLDAVPVVEPVVPALPLMLPVDGVVVVLELPVVVDEPGVPVEPVLVPWRLQAESESAATTARAAAAAWVRVIFIRELLEWDTRCA
jgi:hypothetical protein